MHAQACLAEDDFCVPSAPDHCTHQSRHLPIYSSASWVCANRLSLFWSVFTVELLKAVQARQPCREREDKPARRVGTGVRRWVSSAEVAKTSEGSWVAEPPVGLITH